jgi:hypothetical protein
MLDRSRPFILHGKVEEDFGALTLTVKAVERLPIQRKRKARSARTCT